jgi:hypothetical protein
LGSQLQLSWQELLLFILAAASCMFKLAAACRQPYLLLLHVILNGENDWVGAGMESVPADCFDALLEGHCGGEGASMSDHLREKCEKGVT